jgi:ferredoxin/truncated hemoglobin YjbI
LNSKVSYKNFVVEPSDKETVLEALLRVGADMPFSCKGGSCLTCLSQCTEGRVPQEAQKGLSEHLRQANYLLPCKCVAQTDMTLRAPQPQDMITACLLCETSGHDSGEIRIKFETARHMNYRSGQTLRLVSAGHEESVLVLTSEPSEDMMVDAVLRLPAGQTCPDWLGPNAVFGHEFEVRGPFETTADTPERAPPKTDPALWAELRDGLTARAVLEAFYDKVFADPTLKPFFERSTKDRAIDKQYSFLKQCMTGEKIYFGDRPRNSHHWMIITPALFDYRQKLMIETLREHGLSESQILRWTYFEEHYRPDMVKDKVWPKRIDGVEVDTEGFATETLSEATVCDHCGAEVQSGVSVLYHRRLGTISCPACSAGQQRAPASTADKTSLAN